MPWWGYGPQGMQLWFPSTLSSPLPPAPTPTLAAQKQRHKDIELEFDQVGEGRGEEGREGGGGERELGGRGRGGTGKVKGEEKSGTGRGGIYSIGGSEYGRRRGEGGFIPSASLSPTPPQQPASHLPLLPHSLPLLKEVYPIGISLADASIVGITQRITRAPAPALGASTASLPSAAGVGAAGGALGPLPCMHPVPESQPVLPCLLRRLLQVCGCPVI